MIRDFFSISKSSFIVLAALVLILPYNFYHILPRFQHYVGDYAWYGLFLSIGELLIHWGFVSFLLFVFSFHTASFRFVTIVLFTLSSLYAYTLASFGIIIDESIIANIVDNVSDAGDIISMRLVAYILVLAVLPSYYVLRCSFVPRRTHLPLYLLCTAALIFMSTGIFLAVAPKAQRNHVKTIAATYAPINYLGAVGQYFNKYTATLARNAEKTDVALILDARTTEDDMTVVLVIGESARADHFAYNGYTRDTNPFTKSEQHLVNFSNVTPCSTSTRFSIACMMSRDTYSDFSLPLKETSVISVFKDLGYHTFWYATQSAYGGQNLILQTAIQSDDYAFKSSLRSKLTLHDRMDDTHLLPFLDHALHTDGNRFIVLHTLGSHFVYDDRYPDDYRVYTPVCKSNSPSSCDPQSLINGFDNSIRYTDYFLSQVFDMLRDKRAMVFYVSDHGQFLGEKGMYYHGNKDTLHETPHRVPMLFWVSDELAKETSFKSRLDHARLHKDTPLSHDHLFDSLLDCAGVESSFFERNLTLCRKSITPYQNR